MKVRRFWEYEHEYIVEYEQADQREKGMLTYHAHLIFWNRFYITR